MSKRLQETQGGDDRYGAQNGGAVDPADRPQQATAAQMARRKIAQGKKSSASARSSRANTPTANPFAPQSQSMPSFQLPQGGGDGGGFNFSVNAGGSNPFQNANGASGTPPPSFGMSQQQQPQANGAGSMFGSNNAGFGSGFGQGTPSNGNGFGTNNVNGTKPTSFGGMFGQNTQNQGQQQSTTPASNTSSFGFGQPNGNAGSAFQFGQSQPQTQSTQVTSSFGGFGQPSQTNGDKPATNSFAGFGQSAQQQEKPSPSSVFGGLNAAKPAEKTATPSFSFGQNTQPATGQPASTSLGLFGSGSGAPQANGHNNSSFGSSQQPGQASQSSSGNLFTFNSSNRGIGEKHKQGGAGKSPEPPNAPTSNVFGGQQNGGTGLFGATPPPRESSATPKPGESIFSNQNKPKLGGNLFTSDMAEGKKPEPPATMFGQPAQAKSQPAENAEQTPKPNDVFGGFGQSQVNTTQEVAKPSSNPFNSSSFGQAPVPSSAAPKSMFGQSLQDTSMHTPGSTPQKSFSFTPAATQQPNVSSQHANPSQTTAAGRSLSDRITRDDEPSTADGAATSSFGQSSTAPATQKPLSTQPQDALSSNVFNKPPELQTSAPHASRTSSVAATASTLQPMPASQSRAESSSQDAPKGVPNSEQRTLKALNEGLMTHLAIQNPGEDWTRIMEYYLRQAASIQGKPAPDVTTAASRSAATHGSTTAAASGQQRQQSESTADTGAKNIFANTQQTPKPSSFQPPSTAPVNRKRSAEDEAERGPVTEKRAKPSGSVEYPKLPDNASNVSKRFFNALENKSAAATISAVDGDQKEQASRSSTTQQSDALGGGFRPTGSGFTPAPTGSNPPTPGFTPTIPSGSSANFMSDFGRRASEQEEKDRKKREDDDYDSEEETKEQWLERDRKAQEDKRKNALEAAKAGSGFTVKSAFKPTENETPSTASKDADKEEPAVSAQTNSLFARIEKPTATTADKPSLFASQSTKPATSLFGGTGGPAKSGTGSSLFGHLSQPASKDASPAPEGSEKGEDIEKETQGTGDKSWNPKSPIKFGASAGTALASSNPAAPTPAGGNLFGPKSNTSSSASTGFLNLPSTKPAMGFQFGTQLDGSMNGSRATTPGVATDGEGTGASNAGDAENEPSDDPPAGEAQVGDMTALAADETKGESLLFSVGIAKASKWEEKKDDEGKMVHGWVDKGKGPLYLLKNDDTGKVRILLKAPPFGTAKMNFPPLKGGGYDVQGKTGKQITGTFYDHMTGKPGLGKWLVAVGKKEDAEKVSSILKDGMPQ